MGVVKLYQRLLGYIDLPTKTENTSNLIIKRGCSKFSFGTASFVITINEYHVS